MQLALGQKPALQVGDLPRPVAAHFRCHPAIVWLGTDELRKIVTKHPQIRVEQLQYLHYAIRDGVYYVEKYRPNCVTIYYIVDERTYVIGLKPTSRGSRGMGSDLFLHRQ
jgi:hypothetical protein